MWCWCTQSPVYGEFWDTLYFSKNTDSHRDSGVQQYLLAFTNATVMDVGVFTVAWAEREFSPVHYPFTNPISTELL